MDQGFLLRRCGLTDIRLATPEDISRISANTQLSETSNALALDTREGATYIAFSLADPSCIIGVAYFVRSASDLPGRGSELLHLHVVESHRRLGIGSRLVHSIRDSYKCESWVRIPHSNPHALNWFKHHGYVYNHIEIGSGGSLTVLRWPGVMLVVVHNVVVLFPEYHLFSISRVPTSEDVDDMYRCYLRTIWQNPDLPHGMDIDPGMEDRVRKRIAPVAEADLTQSRLYILPSPKASCAPQLAGFYTVIMSSNAPQRECELYIVCTDQSLSIRDLGHSMMQRIIDEYGSQRTIHLKTWAINVRAQKFYKRYGFVEMRRETEAEARKEGHPPRVYMSRLGPNAHQN